MHSVFHHQDKTICEAAIPEIIVHLQGAKTVLKNEKRIPGKVYVIPHGCLPLANKDKLWDNYQSKHTVIQAGFGFVYKNYGNSITATAILKEKYNDVFFTGLFSESPYNKVGHQLYYDELIQLIEELKVQDNVAIIRGFQSDETLDSYFRTNRVAVFPYDSSPGHEVFGASGAARLAMSANLPIITSRIPHFSDLPSVKVSTPKEMAEALDKMFSDENFMKEQLSKQADYLIENNWSNIARKYLDVFEGKE
jgi:glycosyltransferase involved in cell wall biosynthesis